MNYIDSNSQPFTPSDIWHSNYAKNTISETFDKPTTSEIAANKKYDKFFLQPLNLLNYAEILYDTSPHRHKYTVISKDILEFIASNDYNSYKFLRLYIEKVLKDSGIFAYFNDFLTHEDNVTFYDLKTAFIDFYHNYTPIEKDYEPKRIFTKVLNPLSFYYHKKGTSSGRLSNTSITRDKLMYNRDNFRDLFADKPKEIARSEWLASHPQVVFRYGYFEQVLNHSKVELKSFISKFRNNKSEIPQFILSEIDCSPASQIHHIFPKSDFPEIMGTLENLIALTPNQHFSKAHPNNNTQTIDPNVQKSLLIAKTLSVKQNLLSQDEDHIFSFSSLLHIISIGWDNKDILSISDGDYNAVITMIKTHYEHGNHL